MTVMGLDEKVCPKGKPGADYSCKFCRVYLHRGDCGCSAERSYRIYPGHGGEASGRALCCAECAAMIDALAADSRLGRVHRAIVREAYFHGVGPTDD